ncbi:MAG: iron uptake porin [Cyanobacteria bacterium P01_A01_bin.83]
MNRLFWQTLKVAPVVFAASLFTANSAGAESLSSEGAGVDQTLEQINNYRQMGQDNSQSQVTNVNQLRDVSPTDWAYEALRSLVDRYGCIAGFPNQTYRGNQALTRYEFAAGLNSCLNQIERLIASQGSVGQEDLDTINRLVQEFEAELATVGGRVDELESRAAVLEDNQFSTTTKLNGEVIFALADTFSDVFDIDDPTETTFSDRVRLNFDSSFTGKDRLRTRLEAANVTEFDEEIEDTDGDGSTGIGLDSARLGFDANNDNDFEINDLYYRTRLFDDRVTLYAGTEGLDINNIFDVHNPVLASSGNGALSRFSRRNPIIYRAGGSEGSGVGASVNFLDEKFTVSALYLTEDGESNDPQEGEGIFDGSFTTGAQIEYAPTDNLEVGVVYLRTFQNGDDVNLTGSTGSELAAAPFGDVATSADQVGLSSTLDVGRFNFSLNGAVSFANPEEDDDDDATIYTVFGSVSYLDLFREGSALSVGAGVLPKVVENDGPLGEDDETPLLVEGIYKFPVNDNITVTPGTYVLIDPDGEDEDAIVIGVIRTTFTF